jgi:hypothetical protein
MSEPVTSIAHPPVRMPTVDEIFGERTTPRPALLCSIPDDDTPVSREGRALRHLAADVEEREQQLRDALAERDLFRDLSVALMGALNQATKAGRRKDAVLREHLDRRAS